MNLAIIHPKRALSPLRTTSSALAHPAQITLVRFNRTSQQITLLRAGDELSHPLLKQVCGVRLRSDKQRRRPCSRACHAMLQELLLELDRHSTLSQVDHSLIRNPAMGRLATPAPFIIQTSIPGAWTETPDLCRLRFTDASASPVADTSFSPFAQGRYEWRAQTFFG